MSKLSNRFQITLGDFYGNSSERYILLATESLTNIQDAFIKGAEQLGFWDNENLQMTILNKSTDIVFNHQNRDFLEYFADEFGIDIEGCGNEEYICLWDDDTTIYFLMEIAQTVLSFDWRLDDNIPSFNGIINKMPCTIGEALFKN